MTDLESLQHLARTLDTCLVITPDGRYSVMPLDEAPPCVRPIAADEQIANLRKCVRVRSEYHRRVAESARRMGAAARAEREEGRGDEYRRALEFVERLALLEAVS